MKKALLFFLLLYAFSNSVAQNCPQNIGFEAGNFSGWKLYTGSVNKDVSNAKNVITLTESGVVADRHTLTSSKTAKDPYGQFPIVAPNGSNHSVKLGNDGTNRNAEALTYRFRVPTDKPEFTLSYQYAVVFQDPSHPAYQQPRFNAKVLDVAKNEYIPCASFDYIATSNLPGFVKSTMNTTVWYKDWTTVTLNLSGYQGKELLLEFTTADCTEGGHFGYAYVDVNEDCAGIIRGNEICYNASSFTLTGPASYKEYTWYNGDRSVKFGTGERITFTPALTAGTKVLLDIVPYDGYGCPNTVSTTIQYVNFELNLSAGFRRCAGDVVDLLSPDIILNKSSRVTYTVYEDAGLTKLVVDPSRITKSGDYYIKALSDNISCVDVKSISIVFDDYFSALQVTPLINICKPDFADLTSSIYYKNIPQGATLAYFYDSGLKNPIIDAKKVSPGTYFVKIVKDNCSIVKEIKVSSFAEVILKVKNPNPFCLGVAADLTEPSYYLGSSSNITFTYFKDANFTILVDNPKAVTTNGRYYIKVTSVDGCTVTGFIDLIFENPVLKIKNPAPVCHPQTIDITDKSIYLGTTEGVTYKYYNEDNTPLNNPNSIKISGKYYVEITNAFGCSDREEITVEIVAMPIVNITQPKKVLEPKFVDLTDPSLIEGSSRYQKIAYFEDAQLTKQLANPEKVTKTGLYYIAFYNSLGCYIKQTFDVVVGKHPSVVVPTAFTPLAITNNKIYPFPSNIKKLISFSIYNKWGNLVFKTASVNPEDGWNGYFNGKLQPYETYSWFVEAINEIDEKYQSKGQFVMIL